MAGFLRLQPRYDIAIVGGGHAGLQAGLKAGLLNHSAIVMDRGLRWARSYYAPKMDNIPGFPAGVSGHKLLDEQREALKVQAPGTAYASPARVVKVVPEADGYVVTFERLAALHVVRAPVVILAMGVVDRMPLVQGAIDPIFPWANFGIIDFCVLCDGHTLTGKSVAVIGGTAFAAREVLDLLHWRPSRVTLVTHGEPLVPDLAGTEREELLAELAAAHVDIMTGRITGFTEIKEKRFGLTFEDGTTASFDKGFSGLGMYDLHADIPRSLGARFDEEGYVASDEESRVLAASDGRPIPGLYVAGDQRSGWNQIPEAWATAERAVIHAWAEYLPSRAPTATAPPP